MAVLLVLSMAPGCAGSRTSTFAPPTPEGLAAGARSDSSSHLDVIARGIALRSAGVKEGELVRISGTSGDIEFMERLAVAVAAAGGHPLVTVFSDETLRRWYRDVPERFDSMPDAWLRRIAENVDVEIRVNSGNPAVYGEIAPERLALWDHANRELRGIRRDRGVRTVHVGNDLHPSQWRSRMLGVAQADLERIFWSGIMADSDQLAVTGNRLREYLRTSTTVRVQHANGTDIILKVAGRPVVVSDGTVSSVAETPGLDSALNVTWLPGGEVTLGVDPTSAEGQLVVERLFLDGKVIGPLTLTFAGGRAVALDSDSDMSMMRPYLQSALPLSEHLTGLKFGLNPHVTEPRVLPLMGAGMISLSMGTNITLGGDIDLPFLIFFTLPEATVHIDDRLVVERGRLRP